MFLSWKKTTLIILHEIKRKTIMKLKVKHYITKEDGTGGHYVTEKVTIDVTKFNQKNLIEKGNELVKDILDHWDNYSEKDKERVIEFFNDMSDFNITLDPYDEEDKKGWLDKFWEWLFGGKKK